MNFPSNRILYIKHFFRRKILRRFFKTVAIVTVFSVAEKFLGFLYRIYLSRTIGAEGIGLYQVALSVFALLLTISCSGTPVTVSRLMTKYQAENRPDKVQKVITAGIAFTLLIAIPLCVIFFLLRGSLSFLFSDSHSVAIFLVVLPGLVFTSVYSVLRGVFWGQKDFLPYSVIELLEEVCMIIVGVILISTTTDVYKGSYYAGVAVLVSYLFSFTLASLTFFYRKNKLNNPKSEFKPLLKSALPVTAMRTANSLAVSLVSIILPMRLIASGLTSGQAMSLFGAAAGQALPLLFIPSTLTSAFTLVLIPEISENFYKKRGEYLKKDVEKAVKFTTLVSCLFIPVFIVCGEEIGILIFDSYNCGKYLSASAFLMFFIGLSGITTSILNSIGLEHKTLTFYVISGALMLLSVWFLPQFVGIYALLVGFTFVYALTSILNLVLIAKHCNKPKYIKDLLTSALLIIPTIILGLMTEKLLISILGTTFTFLVCTAVLSVFYIALCFGFNLVEFDLLRVRFMRKKYRKAN